VSSSLSQSSNVFARVPSHFHIPTPHLFLQTAGVVRHGQTAEIGKRIVEFCRTADVGSEKFNMGRAAAERFSARSSRPYGCFSENNFFCKTRKNHWFSENPAHSAHAQCTYTVHIRCSAGENWVMTSNGAKLILRLKHKQVDSRLKIVTAPGTQKEARRNGVQKETNKDKSSSCDVTVTCDKVG